MNEESLPRRKWLRHDVPVSVSDRDPLFFLTVCCQIRNRNQLAIPAVWEVIRDSVETRTRTQQWDCPIFLVMPDHIHALLSFPPDEEFSKIVTGWMRWIACKAGISWQKGFFDHRIRTPQAAREKGTYILENPVRGGLVSDRDRWPYRLVNAAWMTD